MTTDMNQEATVVANAMVVDMMMMMIRTTDSREKVRVERIDTGSRRSTMRALEATAATKRYFLKKKRNEYKKKKKKYISINSNCVIKKKKKIK